jgi:thiamine biosynthesis lipoprotein
VRAALLAILVGLAGCATANLRTYRQVVMGTEATVTIDADDETAAIDAARIAFARLEAVEQALSDWRPSSDARRVEARPGERVAASPWLVEALERSRVAFKATGGAFDPTVGPATRLWREAKAEGRVPDAAETVAAAARVGFARVSWDRAAGWVSVEPGVQLDFGGLGKGLAAEAAVAAMGEAGVPRTLVAIAGDIRTGLPPRGRDGWRVAIDDPPGGDRPTVTLRDASISTSGDASQAIESDGIRVSHLVDPRTGQGSARRIAVTVIGPDGAIVDALGTGLALLGPDDGLAALERSGLASLGYSARFVTPEGVTSSPNFPPADARAAATAAASDSGRRAR